MSGGEPSSIKHIQRAQQVTRLIIFVRAHMQKTALYRKYRPLTFSEVYGQDHITKTLRRQIAGGVPGHAYLFTGTRGTGKTSCAKIFSRAVNCLHPKDGEPCNECEICRGILDGSIFDVYEIDAASNTGVENIRDIREDITYAPISAKYKVYIIDEVHMLSTGAFNALLKTLEEPPEHVIFILATTEPHKVPATILSRCQRFDFFRLNIKKITSILDSVLEKEGKTLDRQSVALVAELADGSVRDALSILDRVLELDTPDQVEKALGVLGKSKLYDAARFAAKGDTDSLYSLVSDMYSSSVDMALFLDELTEVFRRILVSKTTSKPETSLDISEDELVLLKNISPLFTVPYTVYALRTIRQSRIALSRGVDPRAETEICMLLLSKPALSQETDALFARVAAVEKKIESLAAAPVQTIRSEEPKQAVMSEKPEKPVNKEQEAPKTVEKKTEKKEEQIIVPEIREEKPEISSPRENKEEAVVDDEWRELQTLDQISVHIKDMTLQLLIKNYAKAVYRGKEVVIIVEDERDVKDLKKNIDKIRDAFAADHKPDRQIRIEQGADTVKYVGEMYAYNNIESNPMFNFQEGELK